MALNRLMNFPLLVFAISLVVLSLSAWIGTSFRKRRSLEEDEREDFGVVLAATLTLLGLIIGFSFSMAVSRYDQRKNYEEAEANAIGTEYVRADLLPSAESAKVTALLKSYLEQRILFYQTRGEEQLRTINDRTAQLQTDLWAAVRGPAQAQPTAVTALVLAGMNDVLNSQGYTQAAFWNRIPTAAWGFMAAIAVCCNLLLGFGSRFAHRHAGLFFVLPLVVAISFFLIADIDSPRRGVIMVKPQNLISVLQSMRGQ